MWSTSRGRVSVNAIHGRQQAAHNATRHLSSGLWGHSPSATPLTVCCTPGWGQRVQLINENDRGGQRMCSSEDACTITRLQRLLPAMTAMDCSSTVSCCLRCKSDYARSNLRQACCLLASSELLRRLQVATDKMCSCADTHQEFTD